MFKDEGLPIKLSSEGLIPAKEEVKEVTQSNEIDKALAEFEVQSKTMQAVPVPKAKEVSDVPAMVRLIMKLSGGTIKERKTAEYVLVAIALVFLGLSFYISFGPSLSSPSSSQILPPKSPIAQ